MPSAVDTDLPLDPSTAVSANRPLQQDAGSNSPQRPPVSPITPIVSAVDLATTEMPPTDNAPPLEQATFIDKPDPIPFSESDNSDAMALRAAISVLQFQKEKSQRDLQTLQKLKQAALEDPDAFTEELFAGRLKHERDATNPLKATFEGDDEEDEDEEMRDEEDTVKSEGKKSSSKFPQFPSAQDVVRCPPVNWAKYHVVGEPLDKMHEEQRLYPTTGEPSRDEPHMVAAPYNPFAPQNDQYMQTRRGSKRPT